MKPVIVTLFFVVKLGYPNFFYLGAPTIHLPFPDVRPVATFTWRLK